MNKRPTFKVFKEKSLRDKACREEYDVLSTEFELIKKFIRARKRAQLSQVELAKLLKSQQPAIARLEKGGYANASINNLTKVARAMGYSLHVSLKAQKKLN